MLRISSRQNPIVARFRAAARGETDRILLDGVHLVSEAVAAGIRIAIAAVTADAAAPAELDELTSRLVRSGAEVVTVTAPVLDAISPVRSPSAIVALADRPPTGANLMFAGPAPLVVVAVDVQDPGNVGAIVRVAEAAGASGVMTTAASADPFGWKALRGSMGSALRLPLARCESIDEAVATARHHRCRVWATAPRGGRSLFEARLTGPSAILIGGEGPGLADAYVASADERLTIPMHAPVESLNAAVAAALIVYEARRQRGSDAVGTARPPR